MVRRIWRLHSLSSPPIVELWLLKYLPPIRRLASPDLTSLFKKYLALKSSAQSGYPATMSCRMKQITHHWPMSVANLCFLKDVIFTECVANLKQPANNRTKKIQVRYTELTEIKGVDPWVQTTVYCINYFFISIFKNKPTKLFEWGLTEYLN